MRKVYLIASILLLSSVWLVAQTSPSSSGSSPQQPSSTDQSSPSQTSPSQTSPSQTSPSTSSTTQTTTTQTTETSSGTSIEGCLSGSAGSYTLTDTSGKTYQLAGDTSKLTEHVGHQVRLTGSEAGGASGSASSGAGSSASAGGSAAGGSAAGSQPTFTVQKVKMISSSCPASK